MFRVNLPLAVINARIQTVSSFYETCIKSEFFRG